MSELHWRTSSRSQHLECVEVAVQPTETHVRDSKNRAAGHLTIPAPQWRAFLTHLNTAAFHDPTAG